MRNFALPCIAGSGISADATLRRSWQYYTIRVGQSGQKGKRARERHPGGTSHEDVTLRYTIKCEVKSIGCNATDHSEVFGDPADGIGWNGWSEDMALQEHEIEIQPFDIARMRRAVREIILALGEDPDREGLRETPRRVADMYAEVFAGLHQDPEDVLRVGFEEGHQEMVIVKDIPFYSMCEHHFLPFHGVAHVGYIPNGRVVGLSKLARALEILARRPQLQERLSSQLADAIMSALEPAGVGIVIKADHLCMTARGIKKPGSLTVTSAMRGVFQRGASTRAEFLSLINE